MPIRDFSEGEIRHSILNKVCPKITHKRSKHWKGSIYLSDKFISKVKIPNNHPRIMKPKKSKYIARSLNLDDDQFNGLIDCSIKGPTYYRILATSEKS